MPYASWSYRALLLGIVALRRDTEANVPVTELAAYLARDYAYVLADIASLTATGCVRVMHTASGVHVGTLRSLDSILHVA